MGAAPPKARLQQLLAEYFELGDLERAGVAAADEDVAADLAEVHLDAAVEVARDRPRREVVDRGVVRALDGHVRASDELVTAR